MQELMDSQDPAGVRSPWTLTNPHVTTGPHKLMAPQVPTSTRSLWAPRNITQQLTDSQELTDGSLASNRYQKSVGTHKSTSTQELMDTQELMEEVGDLNTPFHAPARTSPVPPAWIHVLEAAEHHPAVPHRLCGSPQLAASRTAGIWGGGGSTDLARNAHSPRHITVKARGDSFPALSLSQQRPGVGGGVEQGGVQHPLTCCSRLGRWGDEFPLRSPRL